MLGVGGSISSVVENKYNISLNGTSDYINIDSFTQHADLANGMAWSLAVWFKGNGNATSGAHTNILFSAHSSDASNRLRIGIDADGTKGVYYSDAQATQADIGNVDLDDGNWHLVVISRPSGSNQQIIVYVDGGTAGTVANTEVLWDNDLTFASIGQEYDPASPTVASDFFGGEIAQLAFWKTELLRDGVIAIYNAGRNADLNVPRPSYQDHGSIIGYWKMGDGLFDDRVNGVIQNQANPGFGSELLLNNSFDELGDEEVTNGTFDTDSDWSKSGSVEIVNGSANFDIDDGVFTRISQNISLTNGKTYKLTLQVLGDDSGKSIYVRDTATGDDGSLQEFITLVEGTTNYTFYFTANANSNAVYVKRQSSGDYEFSIDNVSVKEVDHNDRWNLGTDWSIEDGELKASTPGGTTATAQVVDGFTAGKTYKLSFDVPTVTQGYFRAYAYVGSSGTFTNILQTPDRETGRYETIFEFGGSDKTFRFYGSPVGGDLAIGSINDASLKQINDAAGIVTGATFVADN